MTTANAINNWGEIVGTTLICPTHPDFCESGSSPRDFLWLPRARYGYFQGINELPLGTGGFNQKANGINDDGHVIGENNYYWNLNDLSLSRKLIFPWIDDGPMLKAINNEYPPRIVGFVKVGMSTQATAFRKVLGDLAEVLNPGPNQSGANPHDISDFNLAVGFGRPGTICMEFGECERGHAWPAMTSSPDVMDSLEAEPMGDTPIAVANGVNSHHQIVGHGKEPLHPILPYLQRALFWETSFDEPIALPFLSTFPDDAMVAHAISDQFPNGTLHVVGRSEGDDIAVLWIQDAQENWAAHELLDLIECGDMPHTLLDAVDINNAGWIIAHGENAQQQLTSYVLIPIAGPNTDYGCRGDLNSDGVVNVSDLLILLSAWGSCGTMDACELLLECPADLTGDGQVNVSDMLVLLNNWGLCDGFPTPSEAPQSISQVMASAGLTMEDWDDYVDVMTGEDERAKANWHCWMQNKITQCVTCPTCPGPDPFD